MRRAHDFLTRLLVVLRLVGRDMSEPPEATRALIAASVGLADWSRLVEWLDETREQVAAVWTRLTEEE